MLRSSGAVRTWRADPVGDDVIGRVLDDARFAPSGGNRQAWRVVVIRDRGQRERLGELYRQVWPEYLAQRDAGLRPFSPANPAEAEAEAIDRVRRGEGPEPGWFADGIAKAPVMLAVLIEIAEIAAVDRDAGHYPIAGGASIYPFVQNILLAARDHGLGGVLTTVLARREQEVLGVLGAPDGMALATLLVLGYPEGNWPRATRRPVAQFATLDRFDGPAFSATVSAEIRR